MTREEAIERLEFHKQVWMMVGGIDLCEVLDMAIAALREQPRWISVEERLPERKDARHQRDFYLVALSNGTVKELAYEHDHYDNMLFDVGWHPTAYPVTHWMPLPDPPEVEV